ISYPELSPRFFSFNSPHGACPGCAGLGVQRRFDPALVFSRPDAAFPTALTTAAARALPGVDAAWRPVATRLRVPPRTAVSSYSPQAREALLNGHGDSAERGGVRFEGVLPMLARRLRDTRSVWLRDELQDLMTETTCPDCEGTRLRREARFVRIGGRSIVDVAALSIADAAAFVRTLALGQQDGEIARPILKEVEARLGFLLAVGLEYLTLERAASSLSGGEGQRIRLATQIGSGLVGVLYILDEPSIGLHPRDTARLLE